MSPYPLPLTNLSLLSFQAGHKIANTTLLHISNPQLWKDPLFCINQIKQGARWTSWQTTLLKKLFPGCAAKSDLNQYAGKKDLSSFSPFHVRTVHNILQRDTSSLMIHCRNLASCHQPTECLHWKWSQIEPHLCHLSSDEAKLLPKPYRGIQ